MIVTRERPGQPAAANGSQGYFLEQERLLALQALDILDTEAEPEFDELVEQAARLCAAPVACLSFLDETRQWMKAQTGSWLPEIPRGQSLCARTLLANDLLLLDPENAPALFAATPLTYHDTPVAAYAGYPIRTGEGYVVGVLSVSDVARRSFSPEQQQFLRLLAQQASQALELRLARRARLAAEASVQRKQAFLAAMSHEIRTPIHGIMGLSRLLQESFITPQQEENLAIITSTAENLLSVINDILDFSKVELGKMELERVPFDVEATVRDATRSVQHMAQKKGITLQTIVRSPAGLPTIEGDPLRLRQILLNLLTNALKFTEEGQITVSVEVQHQDAALVHLEFCVDDTGIGISMDKAEEIFRAFDQATSSTARRYGGTGLGLAICRSLIELQGGRIWLEARPGQGSCFRFSLAYPTSAARPYAEAVLPPLAPGLLQGLRVLLAEDNPVNKLLATSLLHTWGVEVAIATDGQQALDLAGRHPYDLILMDIQMPLLTGLEATASLRATPNPNQQTPIIALTANAMPAEVQTFSQHGFTDFLIKPYHEADLYRLLVRTAGRTEAAPDLPQPTYDFSQLGRLAHDAGFIRKMQQLFLDTVPGQLQELKRAVSHGHWATAGQLIHSLKSTYGSMQMEEAIRCLKRLEQALQPPVTTTAPLMSLLELLGAITSRTVELFIQHLRAPAPEPVAATSRPGPLPAAGGSTAVPGGLEQPRQPSSLP